MQLEENYSLLFLNIRMCMSCDYCLINLPELINLLILVSKYQTIGTKIRKNALPIGQTGKYPEKAHINNVYVCS